jgi:hypothetical protein
MENFSSFPPEEEQEFVVFEERMRGAERSAGRIAVIGTLAALLVGLAIIFSDWGNAEPIIKPEPAAAAPAPPAAPAAVAPASGAPAPPPAAPAPAAAPAAAK